MAKIYGQLERAQIENVSADPTSGGLSAGRIWFRTDLTKLKIYNGSAVRDVLVQPYATFTLPASDGSAGQFLKTDGSGQLSYASSQVGPGSATDNAVVRFDGTGGGTTQNSGVIIDDSNNVTGIGQITFTTVAAASANAVGTTMTSTGANAVAATRTRATGTTVAAGGVAISASSMGFNTASSTYVDVSNLSVTITTSGRPVKVMLIADGSGFVSYVGALKIASGAASNIKFLRGSTDIGQMDCFTSHQFIDLPPGSFAQVDDVAAGTYTYKVQVRVSSSSDQADVAYCKLVAYEL
jgi:hypothetical protein